MQTILSDCRRSLEHADIKALQPLRDTRVFLTGATGFVGSWIIAAIACLNDDHGFGIEVAGIARRGPANPRFAAFLDQRRDVAITASDIRQIVGLSARTDWIVHAAADPDSRVHAVDPIGVASAIADGTMRLFRLADQAEQLRKVLHFSSGLVAQPDGAPIGTNTVYREAKRFSEALCAAFRSEARLPVVVTRPYTFIGPFQALAAPWAANNLLHAALCGQPLKLLGGGDTVRSYLYGSDMAVLALQQLVGGKSGETYDLGGTDAIPLIELAQTVVAHAGKPLEIRVNTGGRPAGDAPLVPNMAASIQAFGFKPAFTPADAVARTLAWHRQAASD